MITFFPYFWSEEAEALANIKERYICELGADILEKDVNIDISISTKEYLQAEISEIQVLDSEVESIKKLTADIEEIETMDTSLNNDENISC